MSSLPTISLQKLQSADALSETRKLHDVCLEFGFFYLTDLDLKPGLVDRTISASRTFFTSDNGLKSKYAQDKQVVVPRTCRGYVPSLGETLDPRTGPDLKEAFDFGIERELCGELFEGPTLVPSEDEAPGFARYHYELQAEVLSKIVPVLLESLALGLGLESHTFSKHFELPVLIHRVIYYPPHTGNAGKHTDNGILTVLFQEPAAGTSLKVHSRGKWIDAENRDGMAIVNIGDMMQYWTDGEYVSTPHFVAHRSGASRISIPFFVYPDITAEVHPIGNGEPFRPKDIMRENFNSIWVDGGGAGRARELV